MSEETAATGLTPKQETFVREYLLDLNATRAAVRAGYSADSARQIAAENLSKPDIKAAVEERMRERAERVGVKADDVLREIALIAFADPAEIFDFTGGALRLKLARDISPEARRAVAALKVKVQVEGSGQSARPVEVIDFRMHSKLEALRDLAKHLGLLVDKHEHVFPGGFPVTAADAEAGKAKVEAYLKERREGDHDRPTG